MRKATRSLGFFLILLSSCLFPPLLIFVAQASSDAVKEHPKSKGYRKKLENEMASFGEQRVLFVSKQAEAHDLWQWSTVIVKVCKWLQHSLDFHVNGKLNLGLELEVYLSLGSFGSFFFFLPFFPFLSPCVRCYTSHSQF